MALFGGSKSSSKQLTTSQGAGFSDIEGPARSASVSTGDKSPVVVQEAGAINLDLGYKSGRNDIELNVLDGGAIESAFNFAGGVSGQALDYAADLSAQTLAAVDTINSRASGTISEAVSAVTESARTESENIVVGLQRLGFYALLAGGVVLGIRAFRGKK